MNPFHDMKPREITGPVPADKKDKQQKLSKPPPHSLPQSDTKLSYQPVHIKSSPHIASDGGKSPMSKDKEVHIDTKSSSPPQPLSERKKVHIDTKSSVPSTHDLFAPGKAVNIPKFARRGAYNGFYGDIDDQRAYLPGYAYGGPLSGGATSDSYGASLAYSSSAASTDYAMILATSLAVFLMICIVCFAVNMVTAAGCYVLGRRSAAKVKQARDVEYVAVEVEPEHEEV
eukprot:CAMPEP_0197037592 /NCGR_PEP_ID=MMETSP1384-20130603/14760_1 /TAXON_ID=29189 /ORGANISM="Ammonia sp." /LENGTH=228 /DNA_ID=CAMNT_0042467913 /DNA_START=171 /DNA_END=857 /DNA_ORIENTATION=-